MHVLHMIGNRKGEALRLIIQQLCTKKWFSGRLVDYRPIANTPHISYSMDQLKIPWERVSCDLGVVWQCCTVVRFVLHGYETCETSSPFLASHHARYTLTATRPSSSSLGSSSVEEPEWNGFMQDSGDQTLSLRRKYTSVFQLKSILPPPPLNSLLRTQTCRMLIGTYQYTTLARDQISKI
jgi:hypothetical protein